MTAAGKPQVLRQSTGYWIPVLVWAFEAYLLTDALVRGSWPVAVAWLPWLALVAGLLFALLWWPALILRSTDLTIRNPFFTYRVAYAAITDARVMAVVRIEAPDQSGRFKRITAWNAPGLPRRVRQSQDPGSRLGAWGGSAVPGAADTRQPGLLLSDPNQSQSATLLTRWQAATGHQPNDPYLRRRINPAGCLAVIVPAVACATAVLT